MRIVVTGAAGFVGSNIVKRLLLDSENEVIGVDCFTDYYDVEHKRKALEGIHSDRFTLIDADLSTVNLHEILKDASAIFHEAGQPGVRKSWGSDFSEYTKQNVEVTQRLLEAAKEIHTLQAFVYASSSSVYGDAETYPTYESDLPQPISPYGVTKLAAEHLVSLYGKNFGLPTVSLRYFTVYGPGQRPDMAFHKFIKAGLSGETIQIYGNGEQIREFTHVSDIVEANMLAWKRRPAPGTVINLSGGSSVTVNETLAIISDACGLPLNVDYVEAMDGDVRQTGGSTERARELLGWTPVVDIAAGIKSEVDWLLGFYS